MAAAVVGGVAPELVLLMLEGRECRQVRKPTIEDATAQRRNAMRVYYSPNVTELSVKFNASNTHHYRLLRNDLPEFALIPRPQIHARPARLLYAHTVTAAKTRRRRRGRRRDRRGAAAYGNASMHVFGARSTDPYVFDLSYFSSLRHWRSGAAPRRLPLRTEI